MNKDILKEAAEEFSFDQDILGLLNKIEMQGRHMKRQKNAKNKRKRKQSSRGD